MEGRISKRDRAVERIPPLQRQFESAIATLVARFLGTSGIKHGLSKGLQRERFLISDLFECTFPKRYAFVTGEIHDSFGLASPQMDIIVYNALRHFVFYSDLYTILPAEAPLCCIEVKSKLNQDALREALKAAHTLKSLKPFNTPVVDTHENRVNADDGRPRYLYCVFAFETAYAGDNWGKSVLHEIQELSKQEKINISAIDRVYAIGQGLLIPKDNKGEHVWFRETSTNGEGLFKLYTDVFNFCEREDKRRPRSDIENYVGRSISKPIKL